MRSKLVNTFKSQEWVGWSAFGQNCTGHYENDSIFLSPYLTSSLFLNNDDDKEQVLITVRDLYDYLDPYSLNTNYVYDHFEWSHCRKLGYDMDLL